MQKNRIESKNNSFTDPGRAPQLIGICPSYKAKIDLHTACRATFGNTGQIMSFPWPKSSANLHKIQIQ